MECWGSEGSAGARQRRERRVPAQRKSEGSARGAVEARTPRNGDGKGALRHSGSEDSARGTAEARALQQRRQQARCVNPKWVSQWEQSRGVQGRRSQTI